LLYGKSEPWALFGLVAGGTLVHHAIDSVIAVFSWQIIKLFQRRANTQGLQFTGNDQ